MEWEVRFTDEFGEWWDGLTADEQESVNASVILLQKLGPNLGFPHSSGVAQSRYSYAGVANSTRRQAVQGLVCF
jgi:hypothetical protein